MPFDETTPERGEEPDDFPMSDYAIVGNAFFMALQEGVSIACLHAFWMATDDPLEFDEAVMCEVQRIHAERERNG